MKNPSKNKIKPYPGYKSDKRDHIIACFMGISPLVGCGTTTWLVSNWLWHNPGTLTRLPFGNTPIVLNFYLPIIVGVTSLFFFIFLAFFIGFLVSKLFYLILKDENK